MYTFLWPVFCFKLLLDRIVCGSNLLTSGVFECNIAHSRSVAILCMLYKIRCNPLYPLYGVLYLCHMCHCGLHALCLLATKSRITAGILFPSQYLSGTILLTLYSMVWAGDFADRMSIALSWHCNAHLFHIIIIFKYIF